MTYAKPKKIYMFLLKKQTLFSDLAWNRKTGIWFSNTTLRKERESLSYRLLIRMKHPSMSWISPLWHYDQKFNSYERLIILPYTVFPGTYINTVPNIINWNICHNTKRWNIRHLNTLKDYEKRFMHKVLFKGKS